MVPLILGLGWDPEEEAAHLMEDRKERNKEFMGGEGGEKRGGKERRKKEGREGTQMGERK